MIKSTSYMEIKTCPACGWYPDGKKLHKNNPIIAAKFLLENTLDICPNCGNNTKTKVGQFQWNEEKSFGGFCTKIKEYNIKWKL